MRDRIERARQIDYALINCFNMPRVSCLLETFHSLNENASNPFLIEVIRRGYFVN